MAKAPTADAFYNSFASKPEIIRGEPTYQKLVELRDSIYANASQFPTPLGGGKYGYLGAVIPNADYIALPHTVAFVLPANPGNFQAVGQAGTANKIADRLHAHLERQRQNVEHDALMQALRNLIIESVEEQYIKSLRNKYTRYNAISPKKMLKHLMDNYGKLTPDDILANDNRLNEPWDGSEAFEKIIDRVEECVEFAIEAERPYSPEQILDRVLHIVSKTGLYHEYLKEWKKKAAADKTWPNLKTFMVAAQASNREMQKNSKQAGYGLATEQFKLLANLMAATSANSNNSANKLLTELFKRFDKFEINVDERFKSISRPVGNENKKPWEQKDHGGYCHTHGYCVIKKHTSLNCRNKAPSHKEEATRENNMGGSQNGKPINA
jgi:hypothetical protein